MSGGIHSGADLARPVAKVAELTVVDGQAERSRSLPGEALLAGLLEGA